MKTTRVLPRQRKPVGAKDHVQGQRRIRSSVKAIIADVVANHRLTVRGAIMRGLKASPQFSHHFVKLAAEYTDGKPGDKLDVTFHEDELATAKASLHQKLDTILTTLLSKKDPPPES